MVDIRKYRGFTLIELLVVISIIGLMAGIAIVSVNSVRARARDVKRIADLKILSKNLIIYSTQNPQLALGGCTVAGVSLSTCTKPADPAPVLPFSFATYKDPSGAPDNNVCDNSSAAQCQYSIDKANPLTDSLQVCFYLETDQPSFGSKGPHKLLSDGSIMAGCDH